MTKRFYPLADYKLAIFAVTDAGATIGARLSTETGAELHLINGLIQPSNYTAKVHSFEKLSIHLINTFDKYDGLIFIMSLGIVNRVIAPMITNKYNDPAVVSMDEAGRYAVSVLSGHEGGANNLACIVSSIIGCEPIITTMTETIKTYVCGIGCKKGTKAEAIESAVIEACKTAGIKVSNIRLITSAWIKQREGGMIECASNMGINIRFIPKKQIDFFYLNNHNKRSEFVFRHTGVYGVCEPCALIAAYRGELILKKTSYSGITIAIAKENTPVR